MPHNNSYIPFLSEYRAREQQIQQQPMRDLQQAQGLMSIIGAVQAQQEKQRLLGQEQAFRAELAALGPQATDEQVAAVASKYAPAKDVLHYRQQAATAKAKRDEEARRREEISDAVRGLHGTPAATAPQEVGEGHPVAIAGDPGKVIPSGPMVQDDPKAAKRAHLVRLSEIYADNPAMQRLVAGEMAKLDEPAKPAPQRRRAVGDQEIFEEFKDGKWTEVSRGPRFARQIAPVAQGGYAQQGALDPEKDKEAIRDLAVQSLYDPNSLAGYRRDTKTMGHIQRARVAVMKELGITSEDVVSGRAGFKADTKSLEKITPQYDAITAFEKTAIRNGKILQELADKVDTTGVPVVERWVRAGRKAVAGDPDVAKFHAQMNLFRAEAARILTQPNLSGVLTDTARKEMEHVLGDNASAQQVRQVVDLLERDFNNRKETLEEQIAAIRARMGKRVAPGSPGLPEQKPPSPTGSGWSDEKERRYQELLKKRGS